MVAAQVNVSQHRPSQAWQDKLNDQQRLAVLSSHRHLAIVAGPGTGKTLTLATRVVYLLTAAQVASQQICAITFTHKAADEFRQRVTQLLGNQHRLPFIGTFHSLAYQQLAQEQPQLRLLSLPAQEQLLKNVLSSLTGRKPSLKDAHQALSLVRSKAVGVESFPIEIQDLVVAYRAALEKEQVVDFDGLLEQWLLFLQRQTALPFQHVLIDEFQDTNPLQLEIVRELCRQQAHLSVIGDPRQAIYGFRGASSHSFEWLRQHFPDVHTITLDTNYRSAPQIIHTAQQLFPDDLLLRTARTEAGQVLLIETLDEHTEADLVVRQIEKLVGGTDLLQSSQTESVPGVTFADVVVLYRSKGVARQVMTVLSVKGIPYRVVGEDSMFAHPRCMLTVLGLYRALGGKTTELFETHPELLHQVDPAVVEALHGTKTNSLIDLAQSLAVETGWEAVLEKNKMLKNQWQQWLSGLSRFTSPQQNEEVGAYLAEQLLNQEVEAEADRITLLTMHAAKGLEYEHVFILGCEQGCIPHEKATDHAEEERLFYVALTRAKQQVILSFAQKRSGRPVQRSSFLTKISTNQLKSHHDEALPAVLKKRAKYQAKKNQMQLF